MCRTSRTTLTFTGPSPPPTIFHVFSRFHHSVVLVHGIVSIMAAPLARNRLALSFSLCPRNFLPGSEPHRVATKLYGDSPTSMTHGAEPPAEQKSWFFSTPLMQHDVLSRLLSSPAVAHSKPPHAVHPIGQHAVPFSFVPSKPGMPLLHVAPAVRGKGRTRVGQGESEKWNWYSVSRCHVQYEYSIDYRPTAPQQRGRDTLWQEKVMIV